MQRWKAYMESTEADRRRAQVMPPGEQQKIPAPASPDPDDFGAPWFPDCEPFPRAT